jgi:hypothetical protein
MTAAVAGAATAAKAGGTAAKGAGAGKAAPASKAAKTTPARAKKSPRPPSSKGYMDAVAAGGQKEPAPPPPQNDAPTVISPAPPAPPQWANTGAGFVLALMFWTWVALPFLRSGPPGVKAMIKAKFTNKAPNGSWLP